MTATPICIPNNCCWDDTTETFSRDQAQARTSLQVVDAALRKLRSIHTPVCVISIAGPCRRGKSYIISKLFDRENVFPLGHSFDPETTGIWMWVVPEKQKDEWGREFTVVLLDSEGIEAVGAEGVDDHAIFTLCVLLSSVLIYNSVGVPTRTDLEGLDHIIHLSQRIQVLAGQALDEEASQKVFPSFVWLLRDVLLSLPKGIANLREYFLEKVFRSRGCPSDKSQKVVDNILKFFPDFDAFPLSPPSSDPEVLQSLGVEGSGGEISSNFTQGVKDFQQMMQAKLSPKRSPVGEGMVTGEALATLVQEYVTAVNSPGAVPCVEKAWDVFTQSKCTETLDNAKALYEGGMNELRKDSGLPCDDKRIRDFHCDYKLAALTFFETETADISVTARWTYMLQLAEFAEKVESDLLRENNSLTDELCSGLMTSLRRDWLEPVLEDVRGHDEDTDFDVLEARVRSAYQTLDGEFRRQAKGCKALWDNRAFLFKEEHDKEMKEHIDRLKLRKDYVQNIASIRKARECEAEETEMIRDENARLEEGRQEIETTMAYLREKQIQDDRELQRKQQQLLTAQREQAQAALSAARQQSARERERYQQQQQALQAQIQALEGRRDGQEREINTLRERLQRM